MPPVMPLPQTQSHPELNLLLYAPDNRHMARLGAVLAGQANLRWVDSRETNPRQLLEAAASSAFVLLAGTSIPRRRGAAAVNAHAPARAAWRCTGSVRCPP